MLLVEFIRRLSAPWGESNVTCERVLEHVSCVADGTAEDHAENHAKDLEDKEHI